MGIRVCVGSGTGGQSSAGRQMRDKKVFLHLVLVVRGSCSALWGAGGQTNCLQVGVISKGRCVSVDVSNKRK